MPRATGSFERMQEISFSLLFFLTCFVEFSLEAKRRFFFTPQTGDVDI